MTLVVIMERFILHIDVNNAFLSWTAVERLKNGETIDIRTIPAVIGGNEEDRKGIVLAKSPIAKILPILLFSVFSAKAQNRGNEAIPQIRAGSLYAYSAFSINRPQN